MGHSGTAAFPETVDAILDRHGVSHIAVGHTPTSGVIWPQYDGKVVMIDTGIASAYGGHRGYLEVTADGLSGGYPAGKLPLPARDDERIGYLQRVIALRIANAQTFLRQQSAQVEPLLQKLSLRQPRLRQALGPFPEGLPGQNGT